MLLCLCCPRRPLELQNVDAGWAGVLMYAQENGLQFGSEIAWTSGPVGFLTVPFYSGYLPWVRMGCDVMLSFWVAAGVCQLAWKLKPVPRWLLVFLFGIISANANSYADLMLDSGLLSWGLLAFLETGPRLRWSLAAFGVLSLFCILNKVTYLTVAGSGLVFVAGSLTARGESLLALGLLSGCVAAFVLSWTMLGQSLWLLGAFLRNGWAISQGYDVMALAAPKQVSQAAMAVMLLSVAVLVLRAAWAFEGQTRREWVLRACLFLWLGGMLFVAWKHACIRADPMHTIFLFGLVPVLVLALEAIPSGWQRAREWAQVASAFAIALSALGLEWHNYPGYLKYCLEHTVPVAWESAKILARPNVYHKYFRGELEKERAMAALPMLKRTIGAEPVDAFGHIQSFALMNGLNYRPRPVFQSYSAYTASLARLNDDFYYSQAAPRYVLLALNSLDGRYPALDDPLLLRNLLVNFMPLGSEGPVILFARRTCVEPRTRLLAEGVIANGGRVELARFSDSDLWLEIDPTPTLAGRARQFFYRGAGGSMEMRFDGIESGEVFGAPPALLKTGFIASPMLASSIDVLRLCNRAQVRRPTAYVVHLEGGDLFWKPKIRYRLYRIEDRLGCAPVRVAATPNPPAEDN
jgi:hypothetical protein